jgi:copper chaperone
MKTLKFKTNINCSGCVARVTPTLNNLEGITEWKVDTTDPEKILEIKTENLEDSEIIKKLDTIGFKAETLKK